ncbi:hypothetical protein HN784_02985, partial [bacterium]|nr:hypothetical protein [bacterium]
MSRKLKSILLFFIYLLAITKAKSVFAIYPVVSRKKMRRFGLLLIGLVFFFGITIASPAYGATEFVSIVDPDNATGTDYTTLSAWEAGVQTDLTAATTLVFSHGGITGAIADTDTVTGATSGATAGVVHATDTQILLETISGTFESGEQIYVTQNVNYVTSSDAGNSAIAVATCRSTGGSFDESLVEIDGWTVSEDNYVKVWTDPDDIYGRHNATFSSRGYVMLSLSGASSYNIAVKENYTIIDGLIIVRISSNWAYGNAINISSTYGDMEGIIIRNNFLIQDSIASTDTSRELLYCHTSDGVDDSDVKIHNNVLISQTADLDYGLYIDLDYTNTEAEQSEVYNNTIYGYFDEAAVYITNDNVSDDTYGVLFFNNYAANIHTTTSKPDYSLNGFYDNTSTIFTNNASDDATAGTSNSNQRILIADADFDDVNGYDMHIGQNSSLKDEGNSALIVSDGDTAGMYYDIDYTARDVLVDIGADEVPVEFVSIICEGTGTGGNCADLDYNTLNAWEDAVEVDLTIGTTRVFSGSISGTLAENATVNLCNASTDTGIDGVVVAHTDSGQILIDGITGSTNPVTTTSGYLWKA